MELERVALIGLGLIGGSLARDLAARGARVLGHDSDPETLEAALHDGAIAEALGPGLEGIEEADVVVLAVPVAAAPPLLEALRPRLDRARLVTDVGSTKRTIGLAAVRLGLGDRFVGAHPLAGDHRSGWAAGRPGLFRDARVFLCPTPATSAAARTLASTLWTTVGGRPEFVDADEHDRRLAWTSHLPQVTATALGAALAARGIDRAELGPGGRDTTRLAASAPGLWTDIALDNAASLAPAIAALEARLAELRGALEHGDAETVRRFFASGREWADRGPA